MKSIQRILLALFSVLAPWIIGVTASQATLLNDIRVGDYDTHTRIVFQLSEATVFERIISREPGQLTIIFPSVQPKLTRKIPLERSQRVQEIRLLRRQGSLSAVVDFSFDHFRYELVEYQNPFRLVVDIFHLASSQDAEVAPQMANETRETFDANQPLEQPAGPSEQVLDLTAMSSEDSVSPPPMERVVEGPPDDNPASEMPALPRLSQPEKHQLPTSQPVSLPSANNGSNALDTDSDAKGLQYYLVVGMVVMTIVILLLLLLMLIFKQPKTDDRTIASATNDLRQQDKRIAALNAQIHEQLKRYDQA